MCVDESILPGSDVVFLNVVWLRAFYMNWLGEREFAYGCLT